MSNWQRLSLGMAALVAWFILEGVSITANIKFASSLGSSELDSFVLGFGSVASDLFKAAAPLAFLLFVATQRWTAATATAAIGVVTILFSLMAATGFMAGERFKAYYSAKAAQQQTVEVRDEIAKAKDNRSWATTNKPAAVLAAEVDAMEQDRRYRVTENCTKAKNENETWCRSYRETKVQLAGAEEVAKQDDIIGQKQIVLSETGRDYGDAQIQFLNEQFGVDEKKALLWMIMLAVTLIEVGSAFGLTVALGLLAAPDTMLGRKLGTAFAVVQRKPKVPMAEDVTRAIKSEPPALDPSFAKPAAVTPEAGGLASQLKPVSILSVLMDRKRSAA